MMRSTTIALLLSTFLMLGGLRSAPAQSLELPLIAQEQAQQIGLKRAWVAQVPLDRSRSKITHIKLQDGLLLIVTSENMLYAIDSETGHIQWSFLIGSPRLLALSASASPTHVAVANTTRLFLLDRATGKVVIDRELTGTPERGPVLAGKSVIIPLVRGQLEAYPLPLDDDTKQENVLSPKYYVTAGRLAGDPATLGDLMVWSGDLNQINGHLFGEHEADFMKLVPEVVATRPTIYPPNVYLGTERGYLMAYDEHFNEAWRFSTGSPIHRRPIAIGPAVFVLPEDGGMLAISPKNGEMLWSAPDPVQFVSASGERIYTLDQFGHLVILNAKNGARTTVAQLPRTLKMLTNDQNDRLVVYTDQGLIQSLHETALTKPLSHAPVKAEPAKKTPAGSKPDAAGAAAADNAAK